MLEFDERIKYLEREFFFDPKAKSIGFEGPAWYLRTTIVTRNGEEWYDQVARTNIVELSVELRAKMIAATTTNMNQWFDKKSGKYHA